MIRTEVAEIVATTQERNILITNISIETDSDTSEKRFGEMVRSITNSSDVMIQEETIRIRIGTAIRMSNGAEKRRSELRKTVGIKIN